MNKKLIYYWYVPAEWDNVYDLHLNNIKLYFSRYDFQEKLFVICYNRGDNTVAPYVIITIEKIRDVVPDAKFIFYDNDTVLREAKYFYNEIAMKLGEFGKNDVIFFAHCKGKYSNYKPINIRNLWVDLLYFGNLYYVDKIEDFINDPEKVCFGTLCANTNKYKELNINMPSQFEKQRYQWHYSGTFFWFKPYRILEEIEKNNTQITENNRFFAEMFLGDTIPLDKNKVVCNFGLYEDDILKFIQQLSEKEKSDFIEFHGLRL